MVNYPIRGLIDIRTRLAVNPNGGPRWDVAQNTRRGVAIHYNGGAVNLAKSDIEILQADAYGHTIRDWDTGQGIARGDGLMYAIAIGRNGEKYLCRLLSAVTWHIGRLNPYYYAILVIIGDGQQPTPAQVHALTEVCDDIRAWHGWGRETVRGHQEFMPTSCPGVPLMTGFMIPYRTGKDVTKMAEGMYFEQTGHRIDWGFWAFWRDNGGLPIFGYPLTDETPETLTDGQVHTVQYFERAVFEHWPGNQDPYKVLLRRLGADALAVLLGRTPPP